MQTIFHNAYTTIKDILINKRRENDNPSYCFAKSICGSRHENQDNYLLLFPASSGHDGSCSGRAYFLDNEEPQSRHIDHWHNNSVRIAALDGMGGHLHGREFSEAAIAELTRMPFISTPQQMKELVYELHHRLFSHFASAHQRERCNKSPGATLLLADINRKDGHAVLASVGDSRAWLIQDTIIPLTYDHIPAEFEYRDGLIDNEQYQQIQRSSRSKLSQAIGYGSFGVIPDINGVRQPIFSQNIFLETEEDESINKTGHYDIVSFYLAKGDALLLATDGLWDGYCSSREQISQALWSDICHNNRLSPEYLEWQLQQALRNGSNDNITIAVYNQ